MEAGDGNKLALVMRLQGELIGIFRSEALLRPRPDVFFLLVLVDANLTQFILPFQVLPR